MVLAPLLGAMVFATYVGLWTLEHVAEKRMQEDVELMARAIRLPISDSLEQGEDGGVRKALESVFRIGRVYGAYVYDTGGELVAAVGAVNPDPRRREVVDIAAEGERQGGYDRIQGQDVYSYFVPLSDSGGRISGLLQVTRRGSDFEDLVTGLRFQAFAFIAVAGAVITVLVLVGHKRAIGKHFQRLTGTMAQVEAGQRQCRASAEGPREIASLSRALNTMLDSMNHAENEIAQRRNAQARLEDQLRQSEKLAAIGRLASGVAHELGTPLSVIDGKAQRALRRADAESPEAGALTQIRGEVSRMEHIVRQLLDFGRGSNRQYRRAHAGDLVAAASAALEQEFTQRQVTLRLIGERPGPVLQVDPVRVEQVLVNLMRNAAQSGAGEVQVDWVVHDDAVCFSVNDDGPGVSEEIRDRLFEPFFTTKAVGEGTGLGLAVVHGIVSEHGGEIHFVKGAIGGAGVEVCLPREPIAVANNTGVGAHDSKTEQDNTGAGAAGRG
ncbi:MAG: HAMP domain-containing sensor histidine kinase [Aquisalimonadaceae bacterium]